MRTARRTRTHLWLSLAVVLLVASVTPSLSSQSRRTAERLLDQVDRHAASDRGPAIRSLEERAALARRSEDQMTLSETMLKLSAAYLQSRELNKSLAAAEEAIIAARQAGDRKQEAWALNAAGNALYSMGKFTRAFENFLPAISLMREAGDRLGEALSLKDAGIICKYLRRYDEAFAYLNEALKIFREVNDKTGILSTLHNIGVGYSMLGADRLALEAFEEALEVARDNNDRTGACHVLVRLGYIVRDPKLALDYLSQALDLASRLELYDLQVEVLNGMSGALAEAGQLNRAIEARQRALRINQRLNSRMAVELSGLGHLFLQRDPATAAGYFRRSLAAAETESESPILFSPHHGLAQAYRRQGQLDLAIEHYQTAVDAIESIHTQLASDQHRATFSGKHQHIYNSLIDALIERHERNPGAGDDRRAFVVLERSKARSLVEAIAGGRLDAGEETDPDLRRRERELNTRIGELQKRLIEADVSGEERRELQQSLSEAEQEFERLKVEIKLRNPYYGALGVPDPISVEAAQKLLDDRTAIVFYLVIEDRVFAFAVTSTMFRIERLSITAQVMRARVQNYVDLLAREATIGWQSVSRRLYAELVAPVRKQLSREFDRLVFIPDDALHYLAFETLIQGERSSAPDPSLNLDGPSPDHRAPESFLLEDFTISYAPSATVLAELEAAASEAAPSDRAAVAVFADPALSPELLGKNVSRAPPEVGRSLYEEEGLQVLRIPFSASEAHAIQRYADKGSKIYTGDQASENRIKREQLDRYLVLHFATHGLISQRMPSRSALVLTPGDGEDGFLQAREIYHLKLQTDLVVLSACRTARGRLLGGDGVRGLAQAFLHSGAQSVVASLWDVNDERTALFMETFYRNLAEGKPKAEALRATKLELIRGNATSAPRYWAAFILIGEPGGRVAIGRGMAFEGWAVAVAAGSLVALAGILLVQVRRMKRARRLSGSPQSSGLA